MRLIRAISKRRVVFLMWGLLPFNLAFFNLNSCKKKAPSVSQTRSSELWSESRDYLRSALLKSVGGEAGGGIDLAVLMKEGILNSLPPITDFSANKSIFSSLDLMANYGAGSAKSSSGEVIRAETFSFKSGFAPGLLKLEERSLPFHLALSGQAKINVYRKFSSEDEARAVPPYSLMDLPVTLENARNMRLGDLIVIPIDAHVMSAVDGSFFRSASNVMSALRNFAGSSFIGHAQTGLRANLIVSGQVELHLFKTSDQVVRVRILQKSEKKLDTGANASAIASAKMTLIPFSRLHQVSELKRIKRISFNGSSFSKLPASLMPLNEKNILVKSAINSASSDSFDLEAKSRNDGLVELANSMTETIEQIQEATTDKINKAIDQINQEVIRKAQQPITILKKYADQELKFDAQVSWNETSNNRVQFLGDYLFDLESELGQEAYLHAVSGASTLILANKNGLNPLSQDKKIHNFVLAERISREHWNQKNPPVTRVLSASTRSFMTESAFQIRLGQKTSYSISENWDREQYVLEGETGNQGPLESFYTRWQFSHGYQFGLIADRVTTASGLISGDGMRGGHKPFYWFSREFEGSAQISAGVAERFLNQTYNVLGPVAGSLKLSGFLKDDVEGELSGRLFVGFSAKALERFFSAQHVSANLLIKAVAEVSKSFDNTFGLPFLMFPPGLPAGVYGTSREADCDVIARNWGSSYCHYLVNDVFPRLAKAQNSSDFRDRSDFLESFFGSGFGANKIGAELLARVILQSLVESQGQIGGDELVVWWETRRSRSSAPEFNPLIRYGNPELIELMTGVLPPW